MKFKVWCKDNNEWENDECFINTNGSLFQRKSRLVYTKPDNHIVCIYTGMNDNTMWQELTAEEKAKWLYAGNKIDDWKGKEIYEGDIIEYTGYPEETEPVRIRDHIVFANGCFSLANRVIILCTVLSPYRKLIVVGNIHDKRKMKGVE